MDLGAILFILAVIYFAVFDSKPAGVSEDVNQYDVLYGGDE